MPSPDQNSLAKSLAAVRRSNRPARVLGVLGPDQFYLGQRLQPSIRPERAVVPGSVASTSAHGSNSASQALVSRIEQLEADMERLRERLNRADAEAIASMAAAEFLRQLERSPPDNRQDAETLVFGGSLPSPAEPAPLAPPPPRPRRRLSVRRAARLVGYIAATSILVVPWPVS